MEKSDDWISRARASLCKCEVLWISLSEMREDIFLDLYIVI